VEPKCVEVLHAAFKMVGLKDSADWNQSRKMLDDHFFLLLSEFDESKGPAKTALKTVEKLMKGMDEEGITNSSQALLSIYKWVTAGQSLVEGAQLLKDFS